MSDLCCCIGRSRSLTFVMSLRFHSNLFFDSFMFMVCMFTILLNYGSLAVADIGNCGGELLDVNGSFSSPDRSKLAEIFVNDNGSTSLSCKWRILPLQGTVKLVITKLQMKTGAVSNGCDSFVSLRIVETVTEQNKQPMEIQLCKQELPYIYYSQGSSLDVVLKGQLLHPHYENYSFNALYYTIDAPTSAPIPCGPCGRVLGSNSGSIRSPKYPSQYPNNCDCRWSIYAASGYIIKLQFWDFSLEPEEDLVCHDFVAIYDGSSLSSKSLGKFCGQRSPGSLRTTGRFAYIHFYSDATKVSKGFEVMYELSKDGEDLTSLRSIAAILGGVSFGIFIFLLLCSVVYKRYINTSDRRSAHPPNTSGDSDYLDAVQAAAPPSYHTVMADPEHYPRTPEVTPSASPVVTPSLLRRNTVHSTPLVHCRHPLDSLEEVVDNGVETPPPPYPGGNEEPSIIDTDEELLIDDLPPPPTYAMVSDNESLNTLALAFSEEHVVVDGGICMPSVDSRGHNETSDNLVRTTTQTTSFDENFDSTSATHDPPRTRCRGSEFDSSHVNEELCVQCIEDSVTVRHAPRGISDGGARCDYSLLRTDLENNAVFCTHNSSNRFSRRGNSADSMRSRGGKKVPRLKGHKDRSLSVPSLNNRNERSDFVANHTSVGQSSPSGLRSLFSRRSQPHIQNRIQPNNYIHEGQGTETTEHRSEPQEPTNRNIVLYIGDEISRSSHL